MAVHCRAPKTTQCGCGTWRRGVLPAVLEGHTDGVWVVAESPDQHQALSGSFDNTLRLWDLERGRCLCVFEGQTGNVISVAWETNHAAPSSGSADNTVRLWDVEKGYCLGTLEGHTDWVRSVAWNGGSSPRTVRLR